MSFIRKFSLLFFCILFFAACTQQKETILHDTKDQEIQMSAIKGKWIVVNYWAAWCHTCVIEVSELNKFYNNNLSKNVLVYGVNYDHLTDEALKQAVNQINIEFPVLKEDPLEIWHLSEMEVLPTTFIIDPNGNVAKKLLGANTEESLLEALHAAQENFKA